MKINALASFKMTRQFSQIPHAFSGAKQITYFNETTQVIKAEVKQKFPNALFI